MNPTECNCQQPDAWHPAGDEAFCTRYVLVPVLRDHLIRDRRLRDGSWSPELRTPITE